MKYKILCVVCLLLSSASYCFAQMRWVTGYSNNEWGEPNPERPFMATKRGDYVYNTGDDSGRYTLFFKINVNYFQFCIFDTQLGSGTDLSLYSPLKILIRDSNGDVYKLEQERGFGSEDLIFLGYKGLDEDGNNIENTNINKLIQAISTGSFQVSISGYNEISHRSFRILYNVDIDLQSFKEAWAWYYVEFKRVQKSR